MYATTPETDMDMSTSNAWANDDKLHVQFFTKAVYSAVRSEQEGRPVFEEYPMIKMFIPGDKNTVIEDFVNEVHKKRFASRWEAFEKKMDQPIVGTPLAHWTYATPGLVAELNAMNVHTVEQLADLPDNLAQRLMGNFALREKAKAYLKAAKDTAIVEKQNVELEVLRENLAALQQEMKDLKASKKKE